jgi:hypothetical protein
MAVLGNGQKLHRWCWLPAHTARPNGKAVHVDAGKAFGGEPDDDAGGVEKAGIVRVAIDNGKAAPRMGKLRPKDGCNIPTALENVDCFAGFIGIDGKGEVVVGWKRTFEEIEHSAVEFRVVEELYVGKIGE